MKFVNIGFGNMVSDLRLVSVISPESAPVKRLIQETREKGMLIDATYGRRTKSVLVTDSEHVILSAITPEQIALRYDGSTQIDEIHTVDMDRILYVKEDIRPKMFPLCLFCLQTVQQLQHRIPCLFLDLLFAFLPDFRLQQSLLQTGRSGLHRLEKLVQNTVQMLGGVLPCSLWCFALRR